MISKKDLMNMPRAELHRNLDGSVRFETIVELARHHNLDLGVDSTAELKTKTQITSPMKDLKDPPGNSSPAGPGSGFFAPSLYPPFLFLPYNKKKIFRYKGRA
ncbi:unnamed protein product [marine sediment metagenome]|uniref:Adenosine deaminase domain-containing protein n=1 Tax=marine sediment metagenome TaxID=412755 RepID=X1INQ5_9ZZZZ